MTVINDGENPIRTNNKGALELIETNKTTANNPNKNVNEKPSKNLTLKEVLSNTIKAIQV